MEPDRIAAEIRTQCAAARSICPSQVARALADTEAAWRELMPAVRAAAARLAAAGEVEVTQRGMVVDPERARGPIRIRQAGGGEPA